MKENRYDDDVFFDKYSRMEQVHFIQCAMEDLEYEPECFDVVFSSLAFHYVADFGSLVEKIGRWLTPGGKFVFSVEHPVFTAFLWESMW